MTNAPPPAIPAAWAVAMWDLAQATARFGLTTEAVLPERIAQAVERIRHLGYADPEHNNWCWVCGDLVIPGMDGVDHYHDPCYDEEPQIDRSRMAVD